MPCHLMSQIEGSLVEIYIIYSMSFMQVLVVFHTKTGHGFYTGSSHGISMAFGKWYKKLEIS